MLRQPPRAASRPRAPSPPPSPLRGRDRRATRRPRPALPGSATPCSRAWATAATTSCTTTSGCATRPPRRPRPSTGRSASWPARRRRCRASTSTSRARASATSSSTGGRRAGPATARSSSSRRRGRCAKGRPFSTRVRHFTATPTAVDPAGATVAFFSTPDGSATAPQPDLAHRLYPSNDHPRDKARFTFTLDVPQGTTAVANGVYAGRDARAGAGSGATVQRQPMATELMQIAVGGFTIERASQDGVAVRDVTPTRLDRRPVAEARGRDRRSSAGCASASATTPSTRTGRWSSTPPLGFALETQTLSLFDTSWFDRTPAASGRGDGARADAPVVRRQRLAVRVERRVAQRGPRDVVRDTSRRSAAAPAEDYRRAAPTFEAFMQPATRWATPSARSGGRSPAEERPGSTSSAQRLPRWRARPLRPAPGDRRRGLHDAGAPLGAALPGPLGLDARLIALASEVAGRDLPPSCARGCTARRRRRCPATRTGPWSRRRAAPAA